LPLPQRQQTQVPIQRRICKRFLPGGRVNADKGGFVEEHDSSIYLPGVEGKQSDDKYLFEFLDPCKSLFKEETTRKFFVDILYCHQYNTTLHSPGCNAGVLFCIPNFPITGHLMKTCVVKPLMGCMVK